MVVWVHVYVNTGTKIKWIYSECITLKLLFWHSEKMTRPSIYQVPDYFRVFQLFMVQMFDVLNSRFIIFSPFYTASNRNLLK